MLSVQKVVNIFSDKMEIFYLIFIIIGIGVIFDHLIKQKRLPPGPWGIPIFGFWPFLQKMPHLAFHKLSQKYGDVFSVKIGNRLVVVLNSYEAINKAYLKEANKFDGRPENELFKVGEPPTLFYSEGQTWVDFKRFGISTLRDLHMSKTSLEPVIMDEIQYFLKSIQCLNGKATDIRQLLSLSMNNISNMFVFGKRLKYDDDNYKRFVDLNLEFIKSIFAITEDCHNPFQMRLLRKFLGFPQVFDGKERYSFIHELREIVAKELKKSNPGCENDFLFLWKSEFIKRGPKGKNFSEFHLAKFLSSIYAGTEATVVSFQWSLMLLAIYPEVQRKIQNEIDEVIGKERLLSYGDKIQLPYTEATLHEMDRYVTVTPLILPHCTRETVNFYNYEIPSRTTILANVWSVNQNPSVYPEPEKFKPERFLNAEGKCIKPNQLIPFSIGKRLCPGEVLARMDIFLYMTSLLQHYTIEKPEDKLLSFDFAPRRLLKFPEPHELIIRARN